MIGDPSIDMSMMPPQERSMRTRPIIGISAMPLSQDVFDRREVTALGVGIVAVDVATEHQRRPCRTG